ncbi:D-alanyl-D-alanine carboxypeptidase family protein [Streptomyces sp. NPDC059909]|uniref:D-alanyl-D-alanine carboxypeptidase family protein n=1 Tax=Streptomyces sp. NPDC059909 TaxID=3346998 RepID=UPI00365BD076
MMISSLARPAVTGALALAAAALAVMPAPATAVPRAEPLPPRPVSADVSLLHRSGTHVRPDEDAPDLPDVSALSWLVADARTGEVLAAHNAHRRLPPASTMKTLFALTALPRLSGTRLHTVTDEELADVGEGSSLVGVTPGSTYRLPDLWRGVFLSSGNDAVHVLAELNGGWRTTARQMQDKARALGAFDTHVVSADGYDEPGQVSSAYDLAVFGRTGLENREFARYARTVDAKFPGGTFSDGTPTWTYGIRNTNRLLTGADGVGRYPGIIGVKNGYTTHAGNTLIAAARRDGRTVLVTVMNPQSGGGHAVYEEARSLLDWGFDAAGHVHPVGTLNAPPAPKAQHAGPKAQQAARVPVGRTAKAPDHHDSGNGHDWLWAQLAAAYLAAALVVRWRRGAPPTALLRHRL